MLRKKICLERLFESGFCTALISELVWWWSKYMVW